MSSFAADLNAVLSERKCPVGLILAGKAEASDPYDREALDELATVLDSQLAVYKDKGLKITYQMVADLLRDRGYQVSRQRVSEHANRHCVCSRSAT